MEIVNDTTGRTAQNTLQLVIRGQLWSQPVPLELLLAADLDVETAAGARARHARLRPADDGPPAARATTTRSLRYLRELGGEFAREFPKIASRLGMEGLEVADPYVERLLEGCAFLAARVQLKQDAEFPRLSHRLLEMVYPNLPRAGAFDAGGQRQPVPDAEPAQGPAVPARHGADRAAQRGIEHALRVPHRAGACS